MNLSSYIANELSITERMIEVPSDFRIFFIFIEVRTAPNVSIMPRISHGLLRIDKTGYETSLRSGVVISLQRLCNLPVEDRPFYYSYI